MSRDEAAGDRTIGAFFDVDGTLAASNLVNAYVDFKLYHRSLLTRIVWLLWFVPRLPYYALIDRFSRARFNREFFTNYRGVSLTELRSWAEEDGPRYWSSRLYYDALQEIKVHREQGHRIVLVTGGLKEMVQPLAVMLGADHLAAVEPESRDGSLIGRLTSAPFSGQAKAEQTERLADALGVDLSKSYAYADSYSDGDFLECVAHPVAVNPDRQLRQLARSRGWEVRLWHRRQAEGISPLERVPKPR